MDTAPAIAVYWIAGLHAAHHTAARRPPHCRPLVPHLHDRLIYTPPSALGHWYCICTITVRTMDKVYGQPDLNRA